MEQVSGSPGSSRLVGRLVWPFEKEEVKELLERIARLNTIISIALEMDHFKLSQAIKADIQSIQEETEGIKVDTEAIREALPDLEKKLDGMRVSDDLAKISDWLSPGNLGTQHSDLIARKQPGTGTWFLESDPFSTWLRGPSTTLFCPGMPGAGKTMIAAIAVDHILRTTRSDSVGVAFLYCNYKNDAGASGSSLLAAILKQLLLGQTSVPGDISSMFRQYQSLGMRPPLDEVSSALASVLAMYSRTYIVIDALDECPDGTGARRELIASLRCVQKRFNLSLMLTSRIISDIQAEFATYPMIEIRATTADVKRYLEGQTHRLPRCIQQDRELQNMVQTKIAEAVDGMFLLARLYVDYLLDKRTKAKVRNTLQNLHQGSDALEKAYTGALERIEGQPPGDKALAKEVITWIVNAKSPLSRASLCHALAVRLGDTELDEDNIPDVSDLILVCAGLVTLDEETGIIRLVHYTTQEFFERIGQSWCPNAQMMMASTCITYLCLEPSAKLENLGRGARHHYPFLSYAARFCDNYAETLQEELAGFILPLLSNLRGPWLGSMTLFGWEYSADPPKYWDPGWTGVHVAVALGLDIVLERILPIVDHSVVQFKTSEGYTPLLIAVEQGREPTVRILLHHRADINIVGMEDSPLSFAVRREDVSMVRLLLSRPEVDVNVPGKFESWYWTPLHIAVETGNVSLIQLLLEDRRTDLNLKITLGDGQAGPTALGWALDKGKMHIVNLLRAHGCVDTGIPRLFAAASSGNFDAVNRVLMRHSPEDPVLHTLEGEAILIKAACMGKRKALELLFGNHHLPDPNRADNRGVTHLITAAEHGATMIAQWLLGYRRINPNARCVDGRTPLSVAAAHGHEEIVSSLLKRGDIDPDLPGFDGRTPLSLAADFGHEAIASLIRERQKLKKNGKSC